MPTAVLNPAQVAELVLVAAGALAHVHAGSARSRNASAVWYNAPLFGWTLCWSTWYALTFITLNLETLDIGRFPVLSMCLDVVKGALINIQAGLLLHGIARWTQVRRIPPATWYALPALFILAGLGPVLAGPMNSFLRNVDFLVLAFLASDAVYCLAGAALLRTRVANLSSVGRKVSQPLEQALLWGAGLLALSWLAKWMQGSYQAGKYHWVLLFDLAHLLPPAALLLAAYRTGTVALEVTRASLVRTLVFAIPFSAYVAHKILFPGTMLDRWLTHAMAAVGFALLMGPLPSIALRNLSRALNLDLQRESRAMAALDERLRGRELPSDLPRYAARCIGRILSCPVAVRDASLPSVRAILEASGERRVATLRRATTRELVLAWEDLGGRILLPLRARPAEGSTGGPDVVILLGASRKASRLPSELFTRLTGVLGSLQLALDSRADLHRRLEDERRLQERERLAMLGLLSASAAHEIKNPLSAIRNIAHAARAGTEEGSVLHKDLSMIASEVDRLDATVRRMLHFARDRETCEDAVATLGSVCGLLEQESRSRGIRLDLSTPRGPVPMPMSENDLKAVVFNLVLNALQHTPRDATVSIALSAEGPALEVANPGEIPDDFRPRLFQPLATRGGTGLGLYICRKRAEEAGGRLVHLPRPGRTHFRLSWGSP